MGMKTDFLVIGSGIAGLNYALEVSRFGKVVIVTKKDAVDSATNYAQGGIAVPRDGEDIKSHIRDTLKAGCGLSNKRAVKIMVEEGPAEIKKLINLGVNFSKKDGKLIFGLEGGHSKSRIVFSGDHTGKNLEEVLLREAKKNKNIKILESSFAVKLLVKENRCYGADVYFKKMSRLERIFSKVTMVATGGVGQIYLRTTNPRISTGDGISMAYDAGCEIADMEFVQFHPTVLNIDRSSNFLLTEALRGEGAFLVNEGGERFMKKYSEMEELAPRDVVSRAIFEEMKKGKIYLDATWLDKNFVKKRFSMIYKKLKSLGIDMTKEKIPISPAAHYICGGIKINLEGETNIDGLFASGECSCTGVHGANRLASNSLLESLVFSTRAARHSIKYLDEEIKEVDAKPPKVIPNEPLKEVKIKKLMWKYAGITREENGLKKAMEELEKIKFRGISETRNISLVSKLILKSAIMREESRGVHYRSDYPKARSKWRRHIILKKW
ncbi:MAG: L-aspartate oxidase [Candidatus Aenigmarchaeota archaeon]|nr:L-aspartate oxidase [Candidatus Aenigmarchaeota archaeon]